MYIDEQKFGTNYYVKRKFKIIYHERISKKLGRFVDILIPRICSKFDVWFQIFCSLSISVILRLIKGNFFLRYFEIKTLSRYWYPASENNLHWILANVDIFSPDFEKFNQAKYKTISSNSKNSTKVSMDASWTSLKRFSWLFERYYLDISSSHFNGSSSILFF